MSWQTFLDKVNGKIVEEFGEIYDKIVANFDYLKDEVDGFPDDFESNIYKQDTDPYDGYLEDGTLWVDTSLDPPLWKMWDEYGSEWIELGEVIEHAIGGEMHSASTLSELNAKVSDATLDGTGDSRPPADHTNTAHTTNLVGEAGVVNDMDAKTTPVDADLVLIEDSTHDPANTPKKVTWANVKATLKTYFDTLYTEGNGAEIQPAHISWEMEWREDEDFFQHFQLLISTETQPDPEDEYAVVYDSESKDDQTRWVIWNGTQWVSLPSQGANSIYNTYLVQHTVPAEELERGVHYRVYKRTWNQDDSIYGDWQPLGDMQL